MIITILRKPLEGSVAENTLKHGCGALNIDDTRVSCEVPSVSFTRKVDYPQIQEKGKAGWSKQRGGLKGDVVDWKPSNDGRWPANFILIHKEGCDLKGEDWACVEGCPVRELDEISLANGMHSAGYSKSHNTKRIEGMVNFGGGDLLTNGGRYGDSGGASRFFKQFKKENDQ